MNPAHPYWTGETGVRTGRRSGRWGGFGRAAALLVLAGCMPGHAVEVTLNGSAEGRMYQGHGAVSAGASSRLLIDYPEPQRSEILDFLFLPGYGAALQHLKVEMGGEVNSSDGTEPTHMRTADDQNYHRGYEWWLMKEARARNPDIVLDCLAWGAPGWIGKGNYWSQDMADYVANFLHGAQRIHQLDIQYTGIRNEVVNHPAWIVTLRNTLDARGLSGVKIVAGDEWNGTWHIVDQILASPAVSNAVDVVGAHYPSHHGHGSPTGAKALDQPLWGSEEGIGGASWSRALALARLYNRNYIVGKITKNQIWSPVTAYYDILTAAGSGLMRANQPWSGAYEVSPAIWATAHTTQFAQPGWRYLEEGASALLPAGGSLVTLKSGNNQDYSIIVETSDASIPQSLTFQLTNGLSAAALRVWKTSQTTTFSPVGTIVPVEGRFSYTFEPYAIYSLSTVGGQGRGSAISPPAAPFPLPYVEDFESYPVGATPKYFSDQAGTFEVVARSDGRGRGLRQVLPEVGIQWAAEWYPYTVAGDLNWRDYEINADVQVEGGGFVQLIGRIVDVPGFSDAVPRGYRLLLSTDPGRWEIRDQDRLLGSGHLAFSPDVWHRLRLTFSGRTISAYVDGERVGEIEDGTYPSGMAAVGSGWHHAQFDNVSIFPRHLGPQDLAPLGRATASSVWPEGTTYDAAKATDHMATTRWASAWPPQAQEWIELAFEPAIRYNRSTLVQFADHVRGFHLQHWDGTRWIDDVVGTTLGTARADRFPIVTTHRSRLLIDDMTSSPSIYEFKLYYDLASSTSGPVVVNEWMISNHSAYPDPSDGRYASWFELYNPGDQAVDLSGYGLASSLTNRFQFRVPAGTLIDPHDFLLVWADGEPEQNLPGSDLHVNFELTPADVIAVFTPDGTRVDAVELRTGQVDRSEGSVPDGTMRILPTGRPTPRGSNSRVLATSMQPGAPSMAWKVDFTGIPNQLHRVEANTNLTETTWIGLDQITAHPDGRFSFGDAATPPSSMRVYRADLP